MDKRGNLTSVYTYDSVQQTIEYVVNRLANDKNVIDFYETI